MKNQQLQDELDTLNNKLKEAVATYDEALKVNQSKAQEYDEIKRIVDANKLEVEKYSPENIEKLKNDLVNKNVILGQTQANLESAKQQLQLLQDDLNKIEQELENSTKIRDIAQEKYDVSKKAYEDALSNLNYQRQVLNTINRVLEEANKVHNPAGPVVVEYTPTKETEVNKKDKKTSNKKDDKKDIIKEATEEKETIVDHKVDEKEKEETNVESEDNTSYLDPYIFGGIFVVVAGVIVFIAKKKKNEQ